MIDSRKSRHQSHADINLIANVNSNFLLVHPTTVQSYMSRDFLKTVWDAPARMFDGRSGLIVPSVAHSAMNRSSLFSHL